MISNYGNFNKNAIKLSTPLDQELTLYLLNQKYISTNDVAIIN